MRAQILNSNGGPEMLHLADVERPSAGPGQVLIRIRATSVNPVDIKIREGLPIGPELPAILGADLAGVVEVVGPDVDDLKVGDEVYGCAGGVKGLGGTLAEYIAADARLIAPKPRALTFREAAALPLVSITAWEAIERIAPKKSEVVLVQGGVGGVGHIAVQLASVAGAIVAASVSDDRDFEQLRAFGATNVVNYKNEPVPSFVQRITGGRGFDAIVDTVGGQNLVKSFEAAAVRARIATTNSRASVDLGLMHAKALSLHLVFMLLPMLSGEGREKHGRILREISALADRELLRPLIDPEKFELATAADAHRHLSGGKSKGKVVVDID
ncbi:zinc-dependent alcohol dehydrogenase family protein [Mesorhizobium caraganae]|uniref:zinc-dependent alcohol dehydrogenase family protein n=1 Tax=Mesorhizobium caraganae TaxID=483206 RepID=UPI00193A4DF2|nr:zinc-dependent alcohol dehydrogenase family protein [Mesorhizobium caraganae]MBM2712945.1 zinc-dependent alcohol dehydrogenase family protein [Mesorhizobium caraganae]